MSTLLTDTQVRKMPPKSKAVAVGGVAGLFFVPGSKRGIGKFILRFVSPESGNRRDMGLGTYPTVSIAEVRKAAWRARELLADKVDPITERTRREREAMAQARVPTFADAAKKVHSEISESFRNRKHRDQWINTLSTYVFPKIGDIQVDRLRPSDFADALGSIWLSKVETASRVRQRCERVMLWCLAHEMCDTNPVSAINALLPKQPSKRDRVTHHPAVPWRAMPDVVHTIFEGREMTVGRQALLFLILTATRSGEVRGATWNEFNFDEKIWRIPATRMKTGKAFRVPLSKRAMEILALASSPSLCHGLVFSHGAKLISDMTLTKVLRDARVPSDTDGRVATAHGFRSSFRDWASENGYARDLAERALAHTIANQTEAAYHRTDLLEQRRNMMEAWGAFIHGAELSRHHL